MFRKIYVLMEFSSSGENTSYQGYGLLLLLNMAAVRNMQPSDRELKQPMGWSLWRLTVKLFPILTIEGWILTPLTVDCH